MKQEFKKPKNVTSKRVCPNCGKVGSKGVRMENGKPIYICSRCNHEYIPRGLTGI